MKRAYPIALEPCDEGGYTVHLHDFGSVTEGGSEYEALKMAEDAIGLLGISREDAGQPIPEPSRLADVQARYPDFTVTLVGMDFDRYRREHDSRSVKKNCTIPAWLEYRGRMAGINFSDALQYGVKHALGIA